VVKWVFRHYDCFLQVDGHTEVTAGLSEMFAQVLQVHLGVSNQGWVIGVQQFTNQYTLGLGFSTQPGNVKQPTGAVSVEDDSILFRESMCKKS